MLNATDAKDRALIVVEAHPDEECYSTTDTRYSAGKVQIRGELWTPTATVSNFVFMRLR
jgi:hypothetical protein